MTVIAGLASTAFAPLGGWLTDELGWRGATAILGSVGGSITLVLNVAVLPPVRAHLARAGLRVTVDPPSLAARVRRLRTAGVVLGAIGIGKVPGRLLLFGPVLRFGLARLSAGCGVLQLVALTVPLVSTAPLALVGAALLVGMASGPITVLRSLVVVEMVGVSSFAAVSARLQRATTMARAGAPVAGGTESSPWPDGPGHGPRYSGTPADRGLRTPLVQGRDRFIAAEVRRPPSGPARRPSSGGQSVLDRRTSSRRCRGPVRRDGRARRRRERGPCRRCARWGL